MACLLFLLNDCSQKLDVNGPYKNVPIVYGLLNQQDAVHYIRIQKGYLINGSAYLAANIADSIYYPDILKVTIQALPNGGTYTLSRINGTSQMLPKDSGLFANNPNILYSFTGNLDPTKTYVLTVINTTNTDTISSQTGLVENFNVSTPVYGQSIGLSDANPNEVIWVPATNGLIYDLTVRFNYLEYNAANNQLLKDSFVDIALLSSYLYSPNSGVNNITVPVTSDVILRSLANALSPSLSVYRTFNLQKGMQFKFAAGGPDLANYLTSQQAQSSSLASSAILAPYTNISGGYGVFSSRLFQEVDSVQLTEDGIDSLSCSALSSQLRFLNHLGQLCNQ